MLCTTTIIFLKGACRRPIPNPKRRTGSMRLPRAAWGQRAAPSPPLRALSPALHPPGAQSMIRDPRHIKLLARRCRAGAIAMHRPHPRLSSCLLGHAAVGVIPRAAAAGAGVVDGPPVPWRRARGDLPDAHRCARALAVSNAPQQLTLTLALKSSWASMLCLRAICCCNMQWVRHSLLCNYLFVVSTCVTPSKSLRAHMRTARTRTAMRRAGGAPVVMASGELLTIGSTLSSELSHAQPYCTTCRQIKIMLRWSPD